MEQNTNVTKNLSVGAKESHPATTLSYVLSHILTVRNVESNPSTKALREGKWL